MRRFTVRQRPLQPTKRIHVIHLSSDGSFTTENGDRVAANMYELDDCKIGDKGGACIPSVEKTNFLAKARVSIPKPPIREIPNYDNEVSHSFKRSNGFIKYIPLTVKEEENKVEYNLDRADESWIRKHKLYGEAAPEAKRISLDLFEKMLDCTDKYAGEHRTEPSVDQLESLFQQKFQFNRADSHEVCKHILEYWKKKRKELGKPLLRRYWPLTNINDTNPNLVFRPRGKDEHYRLRKKNKPNEEIIERLIELQANISQALSIARLTHKREQLKLKKIMYIYETVLEVHYLHTNHSGPRPLTYDLKSAFVYEGRTSSILSANSSANAFITFNPIESRSFSTKNEEFVDDITALTSPAVVSRMSPEEKQYLQLLALSQLGGILRDGEYQATSIPALLINQSGSTEICSGSNWLKPVVAKDSYEHFYNTSVSIQSFAVTHIPSTQTTQIRLRGRVGRGNRIIIDRVKEVKPLYGDCSHEIYRGNLPMAGVRERPSNIKKEKEVPSEGIASIALPGMEKAPVLPDFNRWNPMKSTSVKRCFDEVVQDESYIPYCNLETSLNFAQANETPVRVQHSDHLLLLQRNNTNDQVEFFL